MREKPSDLERVREQYLDAETGKLVWVSSEAAGERLADGELVPLPEPYMVGGDHFVMPYTPKITAAFLEREPPPIAGFSEAHLCKRTVVAGPYMIRIWEQA